MEPVSYKHVERALQMLHWVPSEALPAFRARLRHLRNLGIPALPKTGSGRRVEYTQSHIYQLALALQFAEYDTSPATIAAALTKSWEQIEKYIRLARQPNAARQYLVFTPNFLSETWPQKFVSNLWLYRYEDFPKDVVPPSIGPHWNPESHIPRSGLMVIHLSALIRKLEYFLALSLKDML